MIREDRELLAELARLNTAMAPLAMRMMEGSASGAEQREYGQRLIAAGQRMRKRADETDSVIVEGEVVLTGEPRIRHCPPRDITGNGRPSQGRGQRPGGVTAVVVVTTYRGEVWMSIVPPFTWEAIMEIRKVDELIHTLGLAREEAMRSPAPRTRLISHDAAQSG